MTAGTQIRDRVAHRQGRALALLSALAVLAGSIAAQAAPQPPASLKDRRAGALEALSACRAVSDPAARLACSPGRDSRSRRHGRRRRLCRRRAARRRVDIPHARCEW